MKMPPRRDKPEVEAAKSVLEADMMYRYSLYINKDLMNRYLGLCKRKGTDGAKELTAYIERQLAANDA